METAEGNPLFIEQLVAVGAESAESLPSSIHAVLAARIDRLAPGERAVLELASVQGRSFYVRGRGAAGDPDATRSPAHLVSLVQHQLIRSERPEVPGEDAFRFAHALIRETAYHGLPKQRRAELHERVARWLEASPGTQRRGDRATTSPRPTCCSRTSPRSASANASWAAPPRHGWRRPPTPPRPAATAQPSRACWSAPRA